MRSRKLSGNHGHVWGNEQREAVAQIESVLSEPSNSSQIGTVEPRECDAQHFQSWPETRAKAMSLPCYAAHFSLIAFYSVERKSAVFGRVPGHDAGQQRL